MWLRSDTPPPAIKPLLLRKSETQRHIFLPTASSNSTFQHSIHATEVALVLLIDSKLRRYVPCTQT